MPKHALTKDALVLNGKGMSRDEIAKFAREQFGVADRPVKNGSKGTMLTPKVYFYQMSSIDPDIYVASLDPMEPTATRQIAKRFKK